MFKYNMSFQVGCVHISYIYFFISMVTCNSLYMEPLILVEV